MEFCQKCKTLMIPKGDVLVCIKCGCEKKLQSKMQAIIVEKQKHRGGSPIVEKLSETYKKYATELARQNKKTR